MDLQRAGGAGSGKLGDSSRDQREAVRLKPATLACIYGRPAAGSLPLSRVFRWARDIHSFMLRERIKSPRQIAESP